MRAVLFRWWWWRMRRAEHRLLHHLGRGDIDEGRSILLTALLRVREDEKEKEKE